MFKFNIIRLKPNRLLLLAGLALASSLAWSLPDDRNQPIRIKSDKAESDDSKGISIYQGNVDLVQGSIHLSADKVTIYSKDGGIIRITALGKPAHFQQTQKADDPPMHAYGNSIDYYLDEERIELRENARLEQEQNIFTGERINYDIKERVVNAEGGTDTQKQESRVEMVIQPGKVGLEKKKSVVETLNPPGKIEADVKEAPVDTHNQSDKIEPEKKQ